MKFASKFFRLVGTLIFPCVFVLAQENCFKYEKLGRNACEGRMSPFLPELCCRVGRAIARFSAERRLEKHNGLVFADLLCM